MREILSNIILALFIPCLDLQMWSLYQVTFIRQTFQNDMVYLVITLANSHKPLGLH